MIPMLEIIFFLMIVFIFALFSRKLENNSITQMFLVLTALITALLFFTTFNFQDSFPYILFVAELALLLVFSDAFRIGLSYTIKEHDLTLSYRE